MRIGSFLLLSSLGFGACGIPVVNAPYLSEAACEDAVGAWQNPNDPGPRGLAACFFDKLETPFDCTMQEVVPANGRCTVKVRCEGVSDYTLDLRVDGTASVEYSKRSRTSYAEARCTERTFYSNGSCANVLLSLYGSDVQNRKYWCPLFDKTTGQTTKLLVSGYRLLYDYASRRCAASFSAGDLAVTSNLRFATGRVGKPSSNFQLEGAGADQYETVPDTYCEQIIE